ncbi:MAG: hypothetical protein QW279_02690 [Candidatus Jordarchaeaceae archaeon]
MVTDEELEKIRKMSKEEKIEYLENRIDQILSELPEEDKQAMMSAAPQMMDNLLSSEGMELMGKMMENVFSSLSEEDVEKLQSLSEQSKEGAGPEALGQFMGEGMNLIGKIMEKMMSSEGLDLMNKMMEQFGDPEKIGKLVNMSEESQEKLEEVRQLTEAIMSEMSPDDYAELMQRIQAVYDKHIPK